MENENLRFRGLEWYKNINPEIVVIGGAGGIGSWLSLFLARANFEVILVDFDIFEEHNLSGQFAKKSNIGTEKSVAVAANIAEYTSNEITALVERITPEFSTHDFMFSAFDNMTARKDMFSVWKRSWNSINRPLFIDGRLAAEYFQILCVTPETADEYERRFLFEDNEAADAPCSMQQTSHTAAMIAAHMVGFFTNHITNICMKKEVRDVPFYFEYVIPINTTINSINDE